ncbi:Protein of unknown function [Sphingomonas laterariae]|uniref:DUF2958 domain-containing protein n=1 Tax=Edaphosphingomonas laterariae TaxID=861865 RepID=A0A239I761_9SPHN|nr:Protein of unknown function [Sphingomonas laterariae]
MIVLPAPLRHALRQQAARCAQAEAGGMPLDPPPLLKLFNPLGAATWLVTELGEDGDTLFGLADLGFGCPELGHFSLGEIGGIRLPFGLAIERDILFESRDPLSVWAHWAGRSGSIRAAETLLARAPFLRGIPLPRTAPSPANDAGGDAGSDDAGNGHDIGSEP